MKRSGGAGCACGPSGFRRKVSVVEKTLDGIAGALRASLFSEQVADRPGLLQRTDPRVKTVGMVALLVTVGLARSAMVLLALYIFTLFLAVTSRVSLGFFVKRVWLFIPIFAGVIVIPSLFNVVKAGDPLVTLWDFGREVHLGPWALGTSIAITRQGVHGAAIFILRVATSVSLAVLLALTTRRAELLRALRVLFVPRIFILILSMTYRYIFLLLGLTTDMFTARRSRMVGPSTPRDDRQFVAGSMGTLLGKSQTLSEEVYSAMVSRGFNGEPMSIHRFRMRPADWALLVAAGFIAAAAIGGDRLLD